MTQFKCEFCGNIYDLDKAVVVPVKTANETTVGQIYICEECDSKAGLPSENTCVCCGEVIPEGRQVCAKCLEKNGLHVDEFAGLEPPWPLSPEDLPKTCSTPKHTIVYEQDSNPVDIHKIIDDAMEKRDRTVSIYIGEAGVSVSVYPVDHDKVQWIRHKGYLTEDGRYRGRDRFPICSNCGYESPSRAPATYCGGCGELMHGIKEVLGDE